MVAQRTVYPDPDGFGLLAQLDLGHVTHPFADALPAVAASGTA